jgi:protein MpaA
VLGDPNAARPVLVVGCIHGNETAGIAVADRLAAGPPPSGSAIWIIRDLPTVSPQAPGKTLTT